MLEELPLLAWNGTITLGTVLVGGRMLMNGIYKKLDKHEAKLGKVSDRLSHIEGQLSTKE